MSIEALSWAILIVVLALNIVLSIYGIVYRRSLLKKLISLTILSDTVFVAMLSLGYRFVHPLVPPVLLTYDESGVEELLSHASDPLPQALVLTGIVIGLAVNALIAFGIIQLYRLTGTTDAKEAVRTLLEGGEEE